LRLITLFQGRKQTPRFNTRLPRPVNPGPAEPGMPIWYLEGGGLTVSPNPGGHSRLNGAG